MFCISYNICTFVLVAKYIIEKILLSMSCIELILLFETKKSYRMIFGIKFSMSTEYELVSLCKLLSDHLGVNLFSSSKISLYIRAGKAETALYTKPT